MIPLRQSLIVSTCLIVIAGSAPLGADVRTDERTRVELGGMLGRMANVFGGRAAREGVTSTVAVKGNRKVTLSENSGQIVDLDDEKIYDLDIKRKTYRVTTFAERYTKQLYGPMVAGASPREMAAALAVYPLIKPAIERMNAEAAKLEGTAIMTVTTVEAVQSAEQLAAEQAGRKESGRVSASGGIGGLVGGPARRTAQERVQGDVTPLAMVMKTTNEVLKIATEVTAAEVAIPAGFKEQ